MDGKIKKNKFVVYTALFGDYDNLIDPKKKYEGCDFVCFTDQKHLQSDIWDIRIIEDIDLPLNMMNRRYKILPHLFLKDYEYSLYIDSNITLLNNPFNLFEKYLKDNIIAVPNHGRRFCIYEEAKKCIEMGKVDEIVANSQMAYYEADGYPKLNGLAEMNIIFRQHNNYKIIKLMEDWWEQLNKFSKRDQLSFCYVAWKNNINYKLIDESSRRKNKYFFAECHKHDPFYNKMKRYIKKIYYKVFA